MAHHSNSSDMGSKRPITQFPRRDPRRIAVSGLSQPPPASYAPPVGNHPPGFEPTNNRSQPSVFTPPYIHSQQSPALMMIHEPNTRPLASYRPESRPPPTFTPVNPEDAMSNLRISQRSDMPRALPTGALDFYRHRLQLPSSIITNSQVPVGITGGARIRKECMICLEPFSEDGPTNPFPHKCAFCSGRICADCLKGWFLDASKNESTMPPRCCRIIPVSTVSNLLDTCQIELYKAKIEEWCTPDRLYCPVPTCSTFIPPRLYLSQPTKAAKTASSSRAPREEPGFVSRYGHYPTQQPESGDSYDQPPIPSAWDGLPHSSSLNPSNLMKLQVTCPKCHASICTKCRSLTHIADCPKSDIDPELEAYLKTSNIKRCPKCRGGVRKAFGCSSLTCRCGACFCFHCLQPTNICNGGCMASIAPSRVQDGGIADSHESDNPVFDYEPYRKYMACEHRFHHAQPRNDGQREEIQECLICLKKVQTFGVPDTGLSAKGLYTKMAGYTSKRSWPTNLLGEPAWQCTAGHLWCGRCPKLTPAHRVGDETRFYLCDCGIECKHCARAKKVKDSETAWECRCGLIVCGECVGSVRM